MSLFGGSGFLGLKDSKFGETVSDIGDFVIELPNKVVDFGEELGGQTFDTSSETAQKYKEEMAEFRSRQAGGKVGQFIGDNLMLIVIALIGFFLLKD